MNGLELILVLLVVAAGMAVAAERLKVPYPILLVVGGLALAFIPGLPRVDISPELVLLLFLPPLLYAAAWFTSWRDFAANKRPIPQLAIGLVVATTTAVAWAAHTFIPGMSWAVAFVLGAIVSPPDAVAATAVTQRLKVPRRVVTIIEGESLVNDATGLVAYKFALAAVATGTFSLGAASGRFVAGRGGRHRRRARGRLAGGADPPPHGGFPGRDRLHPADALRGVHPGRAPARVGRARHRRRRRLPRLAQPASCCPR